MSEAKDRRRQRNVEAGAMGKLGRGRDRQSAMVKALQNLERTGEGQAESSGKTALDGAMTVSASEHPAVYPTKGHRWIDPEVCRPWRWADRPDSEALHIDELAQSLNRDGQVAPAVVRPIADPQQPAIRYEIIAGYVRWRAAQKAKRQLLADIRPDLADREAFSIMVVENDLRRGLSDYTRAKRYQRALDEGLFASKGDLAEAMGLGNAQLSKYLGFAKLPEAVVAACQNIAALPITTGYILANLCARGFEANVMALLPEIESGAIAGRQLEEIASDPSQLERLLPSSLPARTGNVSGKTGSWHVASASGSRLFTVNLSPRRASIAFADPLRSLLNDERFIERLKDLIEMEYLQADP